MLLQLDLGAMVFIDLLFTIVLVSLEDKCGIHWSRGVLIDGYALAAAFGMLPSN